MFQAGSGAAGEKQRPQHFLLPTMRFFSLAIAPLQSACAQRKTTKLQVGFATALREACTETGLTMPPRQAKAAVKATRPRVYARVKPNVGDDQGAAELFTIDDTTLEYIKEEGAAGQSSTQNSAPGLPLLRCDELRVRCGAHQVRLRQGLRRKVYPGGGALL